MGNKEITSEIKTFNLIVLVLGGIGGLLFAYFSISNSLSDDYPEILGIIMGGFFGLFGTACLVLIFFLERLILKKDRIIIQGVFGNEKRRIKFSEIISYKEIEKRDGNFKWKDLTIFTKTSKHTISSALNSNYDVFRKALTKGKKKKIYAEKLWHYKVNRRFGIGFLIVGFLFLLLFSKGYLGRNTEVQVNDLVQIEGTVATKIEIKKSRKKNRNLSIPIELKEYPKFKFVLVAYGLKATNSSQLISNVEVGEQLQIDILTTQFEKKLTKEKLMNFRDKSFNYRTIGIYGLRDDKESYFDLKFFNKNKKADGNSGAIYLLLVFSIFLLCYGIHELIKIKRPERHKG